MKKIFAFLGIIALSVFTSCTKEIIKEEPAVVYTDDPPKEIWGINQVYKQTNQGLLTAKEIAEAQNRGYNCSQWYDQNTGQWQTYDCGNYYLISVYDYYGLYKGKIYVSRSKKTVSIFGTLLLNAQETVKAKDAAIVDQCSQCWNPVGAQVTITYVH